MTFNSFNLMVSTVFATVFPKTTFARLLTLVRVREMPGDVELPSGPERGLWLPPRHPARGAGPDGVEEVQGEVPPLGEVEADVAEDGLGQQDQEGRCPEEEDRHRVGPSLLPQIFLLLDE